MLARCENSLTFGDELHARLVAALEAEGEYAAGALRADLLGERVIGVLGQARVVHPFDLLVLLEVLGDGHRVLAVLGHAQGQRLDAGEDQERVEGRHRGSQIAQAHHAAGDGEGEIAEGLGQPHAVVAGVGIDQRRVLLLGASQSKVPQSTMTPPIELPWPPMNLVSECTTMSAPCSLGRHR